MPLKEELLEQERMELKIAGIRKVIMLSIKNDGKKYY